MSNRDDEYRQRSNDSRRQQQHGRRYPQSHQDRAAMPPPKEGEIFEGEIVRIEAYGAFCALLGTRWQGLIHISQLYDSRVEQVEDVVSLNDRVWVKVLQVEQQQNDDDTDRHPPRLRIKLSIKDVSQDGSRQDLGRQREEKEQVKTQLETNLNSMIGVAVARDPMENHRLLLKCNHNAANTVTTFRGGYTLVGDDEGEPAESEPKPDSDLLTNESRDLQLKPMGRGRGATLPAWMTAPSGDGPIGGKKDFSGLQSDPESGSDESRENKNEKGNGTRSLLEKNISTVPKEAAKKIEREVGMMITATNLAGQIRTMLKNRRWVDVNKVKGIEAETTPNPRKDDAIHDALIDRTLTAASIPVLQVEAAEQGDDFPKAENTYAWLVSKRFGYH